MATEIIMPKLGLTMTEGTVDIWLKNEGDTVEKGEVVCTISSEKLTHDVEAPESGTLSKILVQAGDDAPCQEPIGLIGDLEEAAETTTEPEKSTPDPTLGVEIDEKSSESEKTKEIISGPSNKDTSRGRIFITPLAKKIAESKNIDYTAINGTGGNGRITKRDVEMYQPPIKVAETVTSTTNTAVGEGLAGMRKTIAQRMMGSIHNSAQVTIHQKADITKLMAFRKELKEKAEIPLVDGQTSITTLLARAVILALKDTPAMNAWYKDGKLEEISEVHLGMAVALDEGLVVPVVQNADKMTLTQLGRTLKERIEKAQNGTLEGKNYSGSTFTISNLGKSGVEYFTPILNSPELGILGVGSLLQELVLDETGQVKQVQKLPLSLTFDHQVIDGSPAADFLGKVISYLERPYGLVL